MKSLLLIPILGLAVFASSCRTAPPLDPMTMKQTERCMPENFHAKPPAGSIHATK